MKYLILITFLFISACTMQFEDNPQARCMGVEKGSAKYWLLVCEESQQ